MVVTHPTLLGHMTIYQAGLHLGNDSRGGKIRFYESKGGNMPPQKFFVF